jgi:hypothetical protein
MPLRGSFFGVKVAVTPVMARIHVGHAGDISRITVKGRLGAGDLKRLERACGTALQERFVPLELDIQQVISVDDAADAYLDRLHARGARIRGSRPLIEH